MPKPFITYQQQISLLQSKHLIIGDAAKAEKILAEVGYFTLIGGYKHPFKNKTTRMYRDGVTFEDIVALYRFDEALRHLFLRYLLKIERRIKSRVAYVFCEAHGDSQTEYLNPANYVRDPHKSQGIQRLISTLSRLATQTTDYPYINPRYRDRIIYTDYFVPAVNVKMAMTKHTDKYSQFILLCFKQGRVFYANNTIGENVRNYLKFSTSYTPIPS